MKKCVFFDRDGIVNEAPGPGYVERWDDFIIVPEFVDVLRKVSGLGYVAVVVTNQRCVALGTVSITVLNGIHDNLCRVLREEHGLDLLDIMVCPHDNNECDCRKPKPGMLLNAAERHNIDLAASWMIGDSERDIEAGLTAGCRTIIVNPVDDVTAADFKVSDMSELVSMIDGILTHGDKGEGR